METKFFYAGTFDPFTRGHLNIVLRALGFYKKGVIGLGVNNGKLPLLNEIARQKLIKASIEYADKVHGTNNIQNLEIVSFKDLTVSAAVSCGANILVRGVRNDANKQEEKVLMDVNERLLNVRGISMEQKLIPAEPKFESVSSSLVRELLRHGEYIALKQYVVPFAHNLLLRQNGLFCCKIRDILEPSGAFFSSQMTEKYMEIMLKRPYHNLSHIAEMLNWLQIYKDEVKDKSAMEKAILYHDYIKDDVQKSFIASWLAKDKFGLFEATDHLNIKRELTGDERLMHDFDLAVLADTSCYADYRNCVRLEYAQVPLDQYIKGRLAVLNSLLANFRFYVLNKTLEEQAKENLAREIAFWKKVQDNGLPKNFAGLEKC